MQRRLVGLSLLSVALASAQAEVLLDFEDPSEATIVVAADGGQGAAAIDGRCATSGAKSLWMGPKDGQSTREDFGFAEVTWHAAAKRDWSRVERLALDVTNASENERSLVFYLYDSRRKKSKNARFAYVLPPRLTRHLVIDLDWKKIDVERTDIRALAFVSCPAYFGNVFIDAVRTLTADETEESGDREETRFRPAVAACIAAERAGQERQEAIRDEEERRRLVKFRADLEAERGVQARRLAEWRAQLAASGEDVSRLIVMQADSMTQIRPRATDFAVLSSVRKGLSLRLARDEYEGVQLAVAAPGAEALKGVSLTVEGEAAERLTVTAEPVGYTLADVPLAHEFAYCEPCATNACGYVRRHRPTPLGWYADPILPFLKTVDVEPGDVQAFYVRVKGAGRDGTPVVARTYRGAVRIRTANAGERVVALTVRVDPFSVGKTSELPLLASFRPYVQPLSLSWTEEQAAARRRDPEAPVNLWRRQEDAWCDLLTEYFILPATIYPPTGDAIPDFRLVRRAAEKGRVGPFVCAPWSLMRGDEATWRETYLEPLKKRYAEACAAGLGRYAMAYGCDETDPEHFRKMQRAIEILKREIPEVPLITTATDPELGVNSPLSGIDAFCPLTTRWNPEKVAASRAAGHKVWWYVACGERAPYANLFVQNPLSEGRLLMGAQAFRMKPDGFLYYAVSKWNQPRAITSGPFTDWSPHGIRHRNRPAYDGDGVWAYCGPGGSPIPTLRLENFRDGVEDYNTAKALERLYLAHADKADAWARAAKALLDVPTSVMESMTNYTDDPAKVRAWRDGMADLISDELKRREER